MIGGNVDREEALEWDRREDDARRIEIENDQFFVAHFEGGALVIGDGDGFDEYCAAHECLTTVRADLVFGGWNADDVFVVQGRANPMIVSPDTKWSRSA